MKYRTKVSTQPYHISFSSYVNFQFSFTLFSLIFRLNFDILFAAFWQSRQIGSRRQVELSVKAAFKFYAILLAQT